MTKSEQLKELLASMTLQEVKEVGISAETYEALTVKKEELMWTPKNREHYYYIGDAGLILSCRWLGDCEDLFRRSTGNVYKTEEIAQKKLDDMKDEVAQVFIKIENYIRNNDDGWVADWDDWDQEKYYIYYNYDNNTFYSGFKYQSRTGDFYMSKQMCSKVLDLLEQEGYRVSK